MSPNDDSNTQRSRIDVGRAIVWGALAGVLVFAATGNPMWMAIGPSIGILLAGISSMAR